MIREGMNGRRVLVIGVAVALAVVFFAAPVVPASGCVFKLQLAGLFPKYQSLGCATVGVGISIGPDSFNGGAWTVAPACAAPSC
jgi:hypothetical protein